MPNANTLDHDFDGFWKEALGEFLVDFLELLAPDVLEWLDLSKPIESLDKELHELFPEDRSGKRFVDKLFRVALKTGATATLLFHVDAQGDPEPSFPERMFIYRYRILDKHRCPVYSIAILADDDPNWRPDRFEKRFYDDLVLFRFRSIKLLDLLPRLSELEASRNPFAILVAAYLRTRGSKADRKRLQWKIELVNLIIEHGHDRAKMIRLLRLVDWVMRLPEDLKSEFHRTVREISERKSMPILMNIEIEAMERGKAEGKAEGIAEGMAEGMAEGIAEGAANAKRSALLRILELRFGRIPDVLARTMAATNDVARLDAAIELAVLAPSLDEFRSRCPISELAP